MSQSNGAASSFTMAKVLPAGSSGTGSTRLHTVASPLIRDAVGLSAVHHRSPVRIRAPASGQVSAG